MAGAWTRLWLVRHGETAWNVEGRIQGHRPTELNAQGTQQAHRLAGYLVGKPFRAIYTSDLPRARQTAEIIASRLGMTVRPRQDLRERYLGRYEGKSAAEVHQMFAQVRGSAAGGHGDLADWSSVPDVETDAAVWERMRQALRTIAAAHPAEDVLVVTHGGVLARVIWQTLGIAAGVPRRFPLSNGITVVLRVEGEDGDFHLQALADLPFLFDHETTVDTATAPRK